MKIFPPHQVEDETKLTKMIEAIENGETLPPVVTFLGQAYSGSHRLAAWEVCGVEPQTIELTNSEMLKAICKYSGGFYDPEFDSPEDIFSVEIYDFNRFCEALFDVTDRDEVKEAVRDQF